jgi:putative ABC transport system permease protein
VIIALLGTTLGLGVGVFFGWAIVRSLAKEGFSVFLIPGGQLAVVVALAALAGVGAAILPARRAAKLDVLRAIASD